MRCILHVGTEKTATTTLQRLFDRERSALAAERVVYTRSAGVGNNWRLAVAAYDDDRFDDRSADAGVDSPESRRVFRASLVASLAAELATARADHNVDTLLLSSEHFHSRLTGESEIRRLAELLSSLGVTRTSVLIYLRDPVSLAASLHSTMVKHGSTRRAPTSPEPGTYYHVLCDHRASIERWQAVFGNVTPRLFEPDALVGHSVVHDFADAIGSTTLAQAAPSTEAGHNGEHLNRSLTTAEVEVLSVVNRLIPATVDGRPDPAHAALVAALERHSTGPSYRLPPGLARRYRDAYAESNEWVRQRFFPEREYLFAAEHPDHDPGPRPPGYDGLANLIAEFWPRGD